MARRGGRDHSILELPAGSGVWRARVYYNGREYRRKVGQSKSLARKVYEQLRTQINDGRFFPKAQNPPAVFGDLLREYREVKRREHKAVMASDAGYRRLLAQFGGRRVATINAADIDEWRDKLAETMSPATVNLHLTILRDLTPRHT
jgi:hypothetical protein